MGRVRFGPKIWPQIWRLLTTWAVGLSITFCPVGCCPIGLHKKTVSFFRWKSKNLKIGIGSHKDQPKSWNSSFFVPPPAIYHTHLWFKQLPISHELHFRFTKTLHRCIPIVDAAMWLYLVSSNPTNVFVRVFIVWGPEGEWTSCHRCCTEQVLLGAGASQSRCFSR